METVLSHLFAFFAFVPCHFLLFKRQYQMYDIHHENKIFDRPRIGKKKCRKIKQNKRNLCKTHFRNTESKISLDSHFKCRWSHIYLGCLFLFVCSFNSNVQSQNSIFRQCFVVRFQLFYFFFMPTNSTPRNR